MHVLVCFRDWVSKKRHEDGATGPTPTRNARKELRSSSQFRSVISSCRKLGKEEEGVFRVEYGDEMEGVEVAEAAAEEIGIAYLAVEEGTRALKDFIPYNGVLNLEGVHRPLLACSILLVAESAYPSVITV
ncbi:hypothetical protein ACFX2B_041444 [Malus domestica]